MLRVTHSSRLAVAATILLAAVFSITLTSAPKLHWVTSSGTCSAAATEANGGASCGSCCEPGPAPDGDSASHGNGGGCNCPDNCCSWDAVFSAPPAPAQAAPPSYVLPVVALHPVDIPRAPGARLLPFSTGPPSIA